MYPIPIIPECSVSVGASQRFCHGQRPLRLLQERITLTHHSIRRSLLLLCPLAGPTAEELFVFQLQVCVRAAVWRLARAAVILDSLAIGGLASRTNHSGLDGPFCISLMLSMTSAFMALTEVAGRPRVSHIERL
ncbi:unnamed protein product [Vitrella brassicaformis CCMP3155]|uniref:Uncharacterized protein n=1 Tax=Vitrella brassicaformis (strain CCMP3155) TaxID=1169540 RepID=A0A0G4H662_VITBC|nr:unnamed protein product [Vitrella brassicaformis CCMP3155]|eukprot:CEM39078.1 unnamed protein product [Vitrella brassicaformis CCMP3155]